MLGDRGAAFHPVAAIDVAHAELVVAHGVVDVTADDAVDAVPRGFRWDKHKAIKKAQADAERSLDGKGRVLLRPSGTEPVLRVMVEGEPRDAIESAAQRIAKAVKTAASA